MINTNGFTGKAQAYAEARPGYPDEAIEYICSLAPKNAVFADIGAGTGKFTSLIARSGNKIFAIEPNEDMRELPHSVSSMKMSFLIDTVTRFLLLNRSFGTKPFFT